MSCFKCCSNDMRSVAQVIKHNPVQKILSKDKEVLVLFPEWIHSNWGNIQQLIDQRGWTFVFLRSSTELPQKIGKHPLPQVVKTLIFTPTKLGNEGVDIYDPNTQTNRKHYERTFAYNYDQFYKEVERLTSEPTTLIATQTSPKTN